MIVDDRVDGLITLEAVLDDQRYNLVRAQSGEEALNQLDDYEFAVILLDVQMPGIDGFETAAKIKATTRHCDVPIIFVSAINKNDQYVHRGYSQGAVDYVFKPFDPHILRSKVSVFVELFLKSKMLEEQTAIVRTSERRERYLRLAELELESLRRYHNLADSVPHLVWRTKPPGLMDYVNKVWTDFTGLNEEQSLGHGWQAAFQEDDLAEFLKAWISALTSKEPFQIECRLLSKEGDLFWFWIQTVPEKNLRGETVSWIGTCTNIHDRKIAQERLEESRGQAESANLAKTNFLANMSHEIRTPLNSILGFAELIMSPTHDSVDTHNHLITIRRNGKQLLKIIDEILDISKVEAGRLEIEKIEFDLDKLLKDVQELLAVQAREKGLKFKIHAMTPLPHRITTDPTRLRQILINIIGNSIKFTTAGHVDVQISWHKTGATDSLLLCRVTDTGAGVDPKSDSQLFQPFVQGDSSTKRCYGGTGLGLALSRRLANALGGNVWLESSQVGKGSVFIAEVTAQTDSDVDFIDQLRSTSENYMLESPKADALRNVSVLVVDDALDNRTLISRFLSGAGATVDTAIDGFDGVSKAMAKDYDIVLMDIQMPELDGCEATLHLRNQGYRKPIIALTAHALKAERESCLNAGCDDHLTKPIDRRTLIGQIARHVVQRI